MPQQHSNLELGHFQHVHSFLNLHCMLPNSTQTQEGLKELQGEKEFPLHHRNREIFLTSRFL